MLRITLLMFLLPGLSGHYVWGQSSKKEAIQKFRDITLLDTSDIAKGKHLEYAPLYSVKQFIEYQAEYGKENVSKKWGNTIIEQLYQDSAFTYFGRGVIPGFNLFVFFRVKTDELKDLHYELFDGNQLKEKFIAEVVPESDKQLVAQKGKHAVIGNYYAYFKYNFNPATRLLGVTYRWRVPGEFKSIINKTYQANYDLSVRQFVK